MMIFSIAVDLIWFFFIYLAIWTSDDYSALAGWERGIQKCCLIVGIINLVLKVISILLAFVFDPEVKAARGGVPQQGTQLH